MQQQLTRVCNLHGVPAPDTVLPLGEDAALGLGALGGAALGEGREEGREGAACKHQGPTTTCNGIERASN